MSRKRPQPRGDVDALLGATAALAQEAQSLITLPVTALRPGPAQPRRTFDQAALEALARSIQAEGVLQPLLVRPVEGRHEIIAGERRWRAAQLAGLTEVPVIVRDLIDRAARAAALVENSGHLPSRSPSASVKPITCHNPLTVIRELHDLHLPCGRAGQAHRQSVGLRANCSAR